jgi:hypothetical protein
LFPILFPYIEQGPLWDFICSRPDSAGRLNSRQYVGGDNTWWTGMSASEKDQLGSVKTYFCPTRGRKTPAFTDSADAGNTKANGPQHDYAFVSRQDTGDAAEWWKVANLSNPEKNTDGFNCSSPFRIAKARDSSLWEWGPRDTFAWWSDGTSNQILIGEKHFTKSHPVGKCTNYSHGDCTYLTAYANGGGVVYVTRTFDHGTGMIYRNNEDVPSDGNVYFGSPHTGICNFLIGDGSVHGISATTSADLLRKLASVKDGNAASLP